MGNLRRPAGATHSKKRLGRGPGSGNGTTAGKGTKGQNSRSGGGVRPGFEGGQMPLYRRIARRGFSNYPFRVERLAVSLSTLDARFSDGDVVSLETLREHGVISRSELLVKILADGEITKKVTVSGLSVSASARRMIEAAGGTVENAPVEKAAQKRPTNRSIRRAESGVTVPKMETVASAADDSEPKETE